MFAIGPAMAWDAYGTLRLKADTTVCFRTPTEVQTAAGSVELGKDQCLTVRADAPPQPVTTGFSDEFLASIGFHRCGDGPSGNLYCYAPPAAPRPKEKP
jgi:hypothetical protein